jgi:hypothetical protein
MDITVTRAADDRLAWDLTDLLGRPVGRITGAGHRFVIEPGERAQSSMAGLKAGPYASLDEALTAIETHTRGACRCAPEEREGQP